MNFDPSSFPVPSRHAITVSFCLVDQLSQDTDAAWMESLLAPEEHQRMQRLARAADRHRYLVTRSMSRCLIAETLHRPPSEIHFELGHRGKPRIAVDQNPDQITFNLSHTAGAIVFALGRGGSIGVDIEAYQRKTSELEIARRFFAPREIADLERCSAPQRSRRFLELWTLKEAYVKARGTGLPFSLKDLAFSLDDSQHMQVTMDGRVDERRDRWSFHQWQLLGTYCLALAAERSTSCRQVHFHQWTGRTPAPPANDTSTVCIPLRRFPADTR